MMLRRFVLNVGIGCLILASVACDSSEIFDPRDLARVTNAEALWKARSFPDYTYEIRVSCFCPPEVTQWTRVTVRNGAVTAADAVDPQSQFPITTLQYWAPIDSIFVDLLRTLTEKEAQWYLDEVIADFDATLGYPTNIEYRAKRNVADGGSVYSLRNVLPLQ
jgi:hypothetical protein